MRRDQRLATTRLFGGCPRPQLRRVAAAFDHVNLAPGEVIATRGLVDPWVYVIDEGRAEVLTAGAVARNLGPGEWFGGVLGSGRPETLRAVTPVVVLVLHRQLLAPLLEDVPALRARLSLPPPACRAPVRRPPAAPAVAPLTAVALRYQAAAPTPVVDPSPTRQRRAWALVAAVTVAAAVFVLTYHPPVAIVRAGRPIDVTHDITVTGVATHPVTGRYLLVWVRVERPTLAGLLGHALSGDARIEWEYEPDPAGRRAAAKVFADAERVATAVATRAADLPADAPITVRFRPRPLGGPSAGLVYALALADLLGRDDLARGRTIAATGTIAADGRVGPVGGLVWKAQGAARGDATILVVPRAQAAGVGFRPTVGVTTLEDARRALRGR